MRLRRQVQSDMLLRNQPRPDPRPQMLIQEPRHIPRTDVFPALKETPRKYWYGICMRLHEICHHFCELDFIFERGDLPLLVREQGGEGVDVVVVDA